MNTNQDRKRILFYLPVVTPWWFEQIVVELIRKLATAHEIHVMIPPLWSGTGIGAGQVNLIQDLAHVHWHVLDGPDHPILRKDASKEDDLVALAEHIAPDIVLARSADLMTPHRFPGTVRFIMEGATPPFAVAPNHVMLAPTLFNFGKLPDLSAEQEARLDRIAEDLWQELSVITRLPERAQFREESGLPADAPVVGLVLEYEHEEMFFDQHHLFDNNAEMIAKVARDLPKGVTLAVTNHPLNELYSDISAVEHEIEELGDRAVLLRASDGPCRTTFALTAHANGMIVGNSKSWGYCTVIGTPMMRFSDFKTGAWANAYSDLRAFFADIAAGTARGPDQHMARRWFAFQLANSILNASDPDLTAEEIVSHALVKVDPARWEAVHSRLFRPEVASKAA